MPDAKPDPYNVLGVSPGTPMDEIRNVWRRMVRETHPDRMMARGVPEEAIKLAEKRLVDINRAWEEISGKGLICASQPIMLNGSTRSSTKRATCWMMANGRAAMM